MFYLTDEELQLQHPTSRLVELNNPSFSKREPRVFLGKNPGAFAGIWTKDRVDEVVRCLTSPSVM